MTASTETSSPLRLAAISAATLVAINLWDYSGLDLALARVMGNVQGLCPSGSLAAYPCSSHRCQVPGLAAGRRPVLGGDMARGVASAATGVAARAVGGIGPLGRFVDCTAQSG